jgi:hypothetical protein
MRRTMAAPRRLARRLTPIHPSGVWDGAGWLSRLTALVTAYVALVVVPATETRVGRRNGRRGDEVEVLGLRRDAPVYPN